MSAMGKNLVHCGEAGAGGNYITFFAELLTASPLIYTMLIYFLFRDSQGEAVQQLGARHLHDRCLRGHEPGTHIQ